MGRLHLAVSIPLAKTLRGKYWSQCITLRSPLKTQMIRKAVKDEAEKIIQVYGADASQTVSKRLGATRQPHRARLKEFLKQVAREVERRKLAARHLAG
jgi:F0F1-type ATP synthase membrane subunit b/b'